MRAMERMSAGGATAGLENGQVASRFDWLRLDKASLWRAGQWLWRWRIVLLMNLFLISPVLMHELRIRDKTLPFCLSASVFWLVAVMFWILAIIPSFAIADLGIRGTVARTLFSHSANTIGILAVTFGIWFVNLFIPALIGSLLILGIKIKKDNK